MLGPVSTLVWVTVGWQINRLLICNQPPRSTQPGHPLWVGAMSTSESWDINKHTIVWQGKLVSG